MSTYNEEIPLKQKLRIADAYIKQLKYEMGVLESEKDELAYQLDESKKETCRLMNELLFCKPPSKADIKRTKAQQNSEEIKQSKSKLQKTIKSLKKDKDNLIIKLLKLEDNSNA